MHVCPSLYNPNHILTLLSIRLFNQRMHVYLCIYLHHSYIHVCTSLIFDCDPFFNGTDNTHQIKCIASICSSKELLQWIDTYNIKITNPEIVTYLLNKDAIGEDAVNEGATSGDNVMNGGVISKISPLRSGAMRNRVAAGSHNNDRISGSESRGGAFRGGISMKGTFNEGLSNEESSSDGISSGGTSSGGVPSGGTPIGGTKWHAFRSAANEHLCCNDAIDLVGKMLTIDHQVTPLGLLDNIYPYPSLI